jgi:glycerol uptake facilitator
MEFNANIVIAEIFGTGLLILLGDGVVAGVLLAKSKTNQLTGVGNSNGWIVITTAWALAVFVGVVVAGPISGAHLNPAVTFGLAVSGGIKWSQVPEYLIGEFIGAFIGAILVSIHYWDHYKATEDQGLKLATFCTAPNIRNYGLNFISEVIGTFVLVFVVLAFGTNGTENGVTIAKGGMAALGAIPVAFLVWSIGLSLGGTTGYAINPARDLGPRIIHAVLPIPGKGASDWGYSWVPVLGPLVGGVLAALIFNSVWVNYMGM